MKWKVIPKKDTKHAICSQCGFVFAFEAHDEEAEEIVLSIYSFCPHCVADMRENNEQQ